MGLVDPFARTKKRLVVPEFSGIANQSPEEKKALVVAEIKGMKTAEQVKEYMADIGHAISPAFKKLEAAQAKALTIIEKIS